MGLEKTVTENVDRLFQDEEKLPYLHKITKRKFLVSNKNMGLRLSIWVDSPIKTIPVNTKLKLQELDWAIPEVK